MELRFNGLTPPLPNERVIEVDLTLPPFLMGARVLLRDSSTAVPLTMDPGIDLLGTAPIIFNMATSCILLCNYPGPGNKRFRPNIRELLPRSTSSTT